jgi:uncharacterized membrane protein
MISVSNPLLLLVALPLAAAACLIWSKGYDNLSARRRRLSLALRLALIGVIVLGFAGATLNLPQSRQAVVFVVDLSNSDAGYKSGMLAMINASLERRPSDARAGVIVVGRQAQVEQPVSALSRLDGFQSSVDADYTNLQNGLELGGAILPDGYRHRVVLLTDGQENVGDGIGAAQLLRAQGARVDSVPVHVRSGPEVLIGGVHMPSQLRPRETFSLDVSVHSTAKTSAELDVYRDRTLISSRRVSLPVGSSQFTFQQGPLPPGFHGYDVHITPVLDTLPQNNSGSAFALVQGAPRVLLIAADPGEAANLLHSLRATGMQADIQTPAQVVPTLSYLQRYSSIAIVDTAADTLGPDLMAELIPYVRDLGRGLAVFGGQESYGLGGYGHTPLEQVLPVRMDLPKRKDLPSAAVVLIVEDLEAMSDVNISKEAAKGVVSLLTQGDQVAINDAPFDNSSGFVVPLQHVTDKQRLEATIDAMAPGDPISYAPYFSAAYHVLTGARARVKHIILLGDGDAEDSVYEKLLKRIRAGGVSVSTVGTNGQGFADFQTMRNIAAWGGGRYYRADSAATIPRIFLREARTVARSGVITGKFYPVELSSSPVLRDVHSVPPLYGYVATTPKATAEMVLASKKLDPILSAWQFGLGRSVAWTSDAAGLWTGDWLRAPGSQRFWANLISWTLPSADGGHLGISTGSANGQGQISVRAPSELGSAPSVTVRIVRPDLRRLSVQLQPTSPGRFAGSFLASGQGSYFVTVEARGAGHAEVGQAGLDVPYSAEYLTTGTNTSFIRSLAKAGGGSVIAQPRSVWQDNLPSVLARRSLAPWLAFIAILLLPIDIGVRRLTVSRRDLQVIKAGLPWRRREERSDRPSTVLLGAVRNLRLGTSAQSSTGESGLYARSSTRQAPGEVGSLHATVPAAATRQPTAEAPPAVTVPASRKQVEETTTSKLLAARRKRH